MRTLWAASAVTAVAATATFDDIRIALMAMAVLLIPSVGLLLKVAIENQTEKLLAGRRRERAEDQAQEKGQ